jgi:hypothetical protein
LGTLTKFFQTFGYDMRRFLAVRNQICIYVCLKEC